MSWLPWVAGVTVAWLVCLPVGFLFHHFLPKRYTR